MPPEQKQTPVDVFRDRLSELADIARILASYCEKTTDLVGVIELATANDGQLLLLMEKMDPKKR